MQTYQVTITRRSGATTAEVKAHDEQTAIDAAYALRALRRSRWDVATAELVAKADKPKRTRQGKYNAKAAGLLTANNGFTRSGWSGSEVVTPKEARILAEVRDMLELKQDEPDTEREDNDIWAFSDITARDVAEATGMTINQVNGALSVMVAKGLLLAENGQSKDTKKHRFLYMTGKGARLSK